VDWDDLCDNVSDEAAELVSRLLIEDPKERLGANGAQEVLKYLLTSQSLIALIRSNLIHFLRMWIGTNF
jgi:hypothetical protein